MFVVPVTRDTRAFSRFFDGALERHVGAALDTESTSVRNPVLDVAESDQAYIVQLEMPGVAKEDVKVEIVGRQVSVQAQGQRTAERKEGERVVYRERSVSSYARSFKLAVEVDQAEAVAKLENGVLTLTLPKRGVRAAAQVTVN